MSKRSVEAAMDFSFPTPEERRAAMCVCCGSHCPGCESPDDYAWRRRDVDLSVLADEVIKTRLTPREAGHGGILVRRLDDIHDSSEIGRVPVERVAVPRQGAEKDI